MKKYLSLFILFLFIANIIRAQESEYEKPFSVPLVGFSFGWVIPGGNMGKIYDPFLSAGIVGLYKTDKNWLWGIDGNFLFGSDNVKTDVLQNQILKDIYSKEGVVISNLGVDAGVVAYNRGFSIGAKAGKLFPLTKKNQNAGIVFMLGAGFLQNQIIFNASLERAPQLEDDYAKGYDNQMRSFQINQFLGYIYMNDSKFYANFYIGFELTQAWSKNTRDYIFYLKAPDNKTYFDAMYTIKGVWMFPLKSRKTTDFYHY